MTAKDKKEAAQGYGSRQIRVSDEVYEVLQKLAAKNPLTATPDSILRAVFGLPAKAR